MKTYVLFLVSITVLSTNTLNAQNNNIGIWDPIHNSFAIEKNSGNECILNDSLGIWEQLGPINNDVLQFDFGSNDANIIYAGSRVNGVFKSFDGGENWQQINSGISNYIIRSIAVHPQDSSIILAGTIENGLFRSNNGGNTWNHLDYINDTTILDITFNPIYGDTVYIGTLNKGVYASWNGGIDWELLTPEDEYYVLQVIVDPNSSNMVYFTSMDTVFQSNDYGHNWISFFNSPDNTRVLSLAIAEGNSNIIFIGTPDALYKSSDGGLNWDVSIDTEDIIINEIIISAENNEIVCVGCPSIGVYKSEDGGNSWLLLNSGGEHIEVIDIKFHPQTNAVIFAGANDFAILRTGITTSLSEFHSYANLHVCCYPNPFSENTTIEYCFPEKIGKKEAQFVLFNDRGSPVKAISLNPETDGMNTFDFNRSTLRSGIYYYGIKIGNSISFRKMIIID